MKSADQKRPLKVFLCHASADKPKVRELYRALKRRGVQPWLDAEDLIPGQNWEVEIPKALHSSDAIIICLSPNSVDKEGYVQKEIKFALDKAMEMPDGRIFIIPARLEECELPFSLKKYHAVDLYEKAGYTKLMQSLKLRASQLERATVQLPKAGETTIEIKPVVEEKKFPEPKEVKPKPQTHPTPAPDNVDVGGDVKGSVIVSGSGNVINFGNQEKSAPEKPQPAKPEPKKTNPPRKPKTAVIVALIGLVGTILAALISSPWFIKIFSPTPTETQIPASQTPVPTSLPAEITDDKDIKMGLVPAGQFAMGSNNSEEDEKPLHLVYLDAFYMDIYEVTNAAYKACVKTGGCTPPQDIGSSTRDSYYGNSQFDNYPVVNVDWNQANAYCKWRDASLPTEAQWEKAARGTDGRTYPWGENSACGQANYASCIGDTTEVTGYESGKSPYGMYNMAGNVWEWVADWYAEKYYQNSPVLNPQGPGSGTFRILRGGSWSDVSDIRMINRLSSGLSYASTVVGFRCARSSP
ncbi:MAG: SUMF1/EgtB/PvdO family nonheme iron enzyme [Anaerolineales bacterium]|nr:SUMF1/EgtB/PvdO family nonheme iron enzyme [Anaerolineales bacterium]